MRNWTGGGSSTAEATALVPVQLERRAQTSSRQFQTAPARSPPPTLVITFVHILSRLPVQTSGQCGLADPSWGDRRVSRNLVLGIKCWKLNFGYFGKLTFSAMSRTLSHGFANSGGYKSIFVLPCLRFLCGPLTSFALLAHFFLLLLHFRSCLFKHF